MAETFFGRPPSPIYIFPRSMETLLTSNTEDIPRTPAAEVYYQNYLKAYEDSAGSMPPKMAKGPKGSLTTIKEIESRIYVDLWKNTNYRGRGERTFEILRKITVGFLRRETGSDIYRLYQHPDEKPYFKDKSNVYIVLTVDPKNTGKRVFIDGNAGGYVFSSEQSPTKAAYIPVDNMSPGYMAECTLRIFCTQGNISHEGEIEIAVYLMYKKNGRDIKLGREYRLPMTLCRCPQLPDNDSSREDPFAFLMKDGKDKDIFVMPRFCQEEKHRPYIKNLQIYSNQVLARHKGMPQKEDTEPTQDGKFYFVKEDGLYTEQLGINYGMSVNIFRRTESGKAISDGHRELLTRFLYNFRSFGQAAGLSDFLALNYDMDKDTVQKLVIDRNFIYGREEHQPKMEDIEGLKNLYDKVVQVFRQNFVEVAESHVNFPIRWLTRPGGYINPRRLANNPNDNPNPNYRRGNLTITNSINIMVYNADGEPVAITNQTGRVLLEAGVALRVGTIVRFPREWDPHDNVTETYRYRVGSIRLPNGTEITAPENQSWFIPLSYDNKRQCADNVINENFCDYILDERDLQQIRDENERNLDDRNIRALNAYRRQNGVPYYMSEEGETGRKFAYDNFSQRLSANVNANAITWYSYDDNSLSKPNMPHNPREGRLGGMGLDCSGLVINCFLDCLLRYGEEETMHFFTERGDFRVNGEQASVIGPNRTRKIPIDTVTDNDTLIQSADLLYTNSPGHIALCAIGQNVYVPRNECDTGHFPIIHNYGENRVWTNIGWFYGGFFKKSLCCPFLHWGVGFGAADNQVKAGRIYLWY